MALKPYGIAARLVDAVALTAAFGGGTKIGIGAGGAADCDILAPAGPVLTAAEARAACAIPASQYVFTFGNTESGDLAPIIGPVMDLLASASGTGFLAACMATPWDGRSVYQGHLFQHGNLQGDLKQSLAPFIDGRISVVPYAVVAAGATAIRAQLTAMKEQGVRLALLDAIEDAQCGFITEALARQPVIAGPAWISSGVDKSGVDAPGVDAPGVDGRRLGGVHLGGEHLGACTWGGGSNGACGATRTGGVIGGGGAIGSSMTMTGVTLDVSPIAAASRLRDRPAAAAGAPSR